MFPDETPIDFTPDRAHSPFCTGRGYDYAHRADAGAENVRSGQSIRGDAEIESQ